MVQISNAAIVATILVAPVLAVPVRYAASDEGQQHEANTHRVRQNEVQRHQVEQGQQPEPLPLQRAASGKPMSTFSKVAGVAGGALGAVSTGAGIASLIPAQEEEAQAREYDEELEVREPRRKINFRKIASIGGKTLGAVSTAAGLAAFIPGLQAREFDEELEERDPRRKINFRKIASVGGSTLGAVSTAAGLASLIPGLQAREFDEERDYDEELEIRDPRRINFRKIASVAGSTLGAVSTAAGLAALVPAMQAREYEEEIEVRDPRRINFRKFASVAGSTLGAVSTAAGLAALVPGMQAREYDDELEVRDPKLKGDFRLVISHKPREFDDELEIREPVRAGRFRRYRLKSGDGTTILSGVAGAAGFGGAVAIQQTARDVSYDELD